MAYPHRIAAGGIIFRGNSILLVKYREEKSGHTYLVGPGGALLDYENIVQAIIRETKEETSIDVNPKRVIIVEDIISASYKDMGICKMIKIWMLCDYIGGEIQKTKEAEEEGIIDADWFTIEQLRNEKVYPKVLSENDWEEMKKESWRIRILSSRSV